MRLCLRPHGVLQHADDLDLELLDPAALEDGAADAHHARADLVERQHVVGARHAGHGQRRHQRQRQIRTRHPCSLGSPRSAAVTITDIPS